MSKADEKVTPIDLGLPTNPANRQGVRMVKLMRPICQTKLDENDQVIFLGCEDPTVIRPSWWLTCEHDPYLSTRELRETKPVYAEAREDGRKAISGYETVVWHEDHPNITQVPMSIRINNGRGVEHYQMRLGWKPPEALGYKPFCQFSECWSQKITHRGSHGDYCCEDHAKLIAADETETKLEILDPKKRARQFASISTA